jgi:hypothetical protein
VFKQLVTNHNRKFRVTYGSPQLPLAMYRELEAHLNQVEAIATALVWADHQEFNYADSQIDSIWISFAEIVSDRSYVLVESILNHYGSWQLIDSPGTKITKITKITERTGHTGHTERIEHIDCSDPKAHITDQVGSANRS